MEYAILGFLVINFLLLVGIAGSLAKIIKHFQSLDSQKDEWMRIVQSKKTSSEVVKNYSDIQNNANWDGIPVAKNWDGVPS